MNTYSDSFWMGLFTLLGLIVTTIATTIGAWLSAKAAANARKAVEKSEEIEFITAQTAVKVDENAVKTHKILDQTNGNLTAANKQIAELHETVRMLVEKKDD